MNNLQFTLKTIMQLQAVAIVKDHNGEPYFNPDIKVGTIYGVDDNGDMFYFNPPWNARSLFSEMVIFEPYVYCRDYWRSAGFNVNEKTDAPYFASIQQSTFVFK